MMLPLAGYRAGSDAVLLSPDGAISAHAFFARAQELAGLLPDAPFIINLAESRVGFMLGFAASLIRGKTSLLPSGQGRGDWEQLMHQYPGAAIISDRPIGARDAFDLKPYLKMDGSSHPRSLSAISIPCIPAEFNAALLFTSGSTGKPTAHSKSWGQLARGAALLSAALGLTRPMPYAVVGSVPPQHMFGLESTVMLPWQAGIPVHADKPLLPADIETALGQCARPCWWMATPVHLRPPLQAATALRGLVGVVASTMSLPPALAAAAEAKWRVPVVEVYGSTETGALATRRTAIEEWWTPLPDVKLAPQTDVEAQPILVSGSHIDVPVLLADELRINADGQFLWLGRSADMLKIGGKRASLSALNQRITEIPGVDDAVYFVPDAAGDAALHDDTHPARRLAAFYVSTQLSPEQVQAALRARIDPVFVPRPIFRVPHLPRNANGKLPQAVLMELFSQLRTANILAAPADHSTDLSAVVPSDHPAISGHFPDNPIVPGVVILSRMVDAIRRRFPQVVPGTLLAMRFYVPLRPGQPFTISAELRNERVFVEIRHNAGNAMPGKLIAAGQWACAAVTCADTNLSHA